MKHSLFSETSYTVAVEPNEVRTYYWTVPSHVGPAHDDPNCIVYHYISGVDPVRDSNSGLVGPMLICKSNSLDTDGKQVRLLA